MFCRLPFPEGCDLGNLMAALASVTAQGQFKWEGTEFEIEKE